MLWGLCILRWILVLFCTETRYQLSNAVIIAASPAQGDQVNRRLEEECDGVVKADTTSTPLSYRTAYTTSQDPLQAEKAAAMADWSIMKGYNKLQDMAYRNEVFTMEQDNAYSGPVPSVIPDVPDYTHHGPQGQMDDEKAKLQLHDISLTTSSSNTSSSTEVDSTDADAVQSTDGAGVEDDVPRTAKEHAAYLAERHSIQDRSQNDPRWRPLDGPYAHPRTPSQEEYESEVEWSGVPDDQIPNGEESLNYKINTAYIHGGDHTSFRFRTSTTTTTTWTTTTPGMRNASNSSGLGRVNPLDDVFINDEIHPGKKARAWNHASDRQRKNKIMTIGDPQFDGYDAWRIDEDAADGTWTDYYNSMHYFEGFHKGERDERDQYSVWGVGNSWQRGWCFDRRTYRMAEENRFGSHTNLNCMMYCLYNYEQEDPELSLQPLMDEYWSDISHKEDSAHGQEYAWMTAKPAPDFKCMRDLPWWEYCDAKDNDAWKSFSSSGDEHPDSDWYTAKTDGRLCPLGQAINPITGRIPFTANYEENVESSDMLNPIMLHDESNPVAGLGSFVEDYSVGTVSYPDRETFRMRCSHSIVPGFLMDMSSPDSFVQPDTDIRDHPIGYFPRCSEERPWICDGEWNSSGVFGERTTTVNEELEALGGAPLKRVFGHPNIKFNFLDEALLRKSKAWHDSDFPTWRIGIVSEDMVMAQSQKYHITPQWTDMTLEDNNVASLITNPWRHNRFDILSRINWLEERWQAANACQHHCELTPGCNSFVHFETMHQNWQIGYNHKTGEGISCLLKFDVQNRALLEIEGRYPYKGYRNDDYATPLKRQRCAKKLELPDSGPGTDQPGCDGEIEYQPPGASTAKSVPEQWEGNPFCPLRWWLNRPSTNDSNGQFGDNPLSLFAHRFEALGPVTASDWDPDYSAAGKCVFKDNTIQAGPKTCIIYHGEGADHADPLGLADRATSYEYMESIPRAIMDYTHVSGVDHLLEWDHTRGKDSWKGFNKIMQFHRHEVSVNTANWRLDGWYDFVGDDGIPMNQNHQRPLSWAAPFDPATGLPPVSNFNSRMYSEVKATRSRRLSEGTLSRDQLQKTLAIQPAIPTPQELANLLAHDGVRLQKEYHTALRRLKEEVQKEVSSEQGESSQTATVRLQPHQVARANVVRYVHHQINYPKGRAFRPSRRVDREVRKSFRQQEKRRRFREKKQRARAPESIISKARLHRNTNVGTMFL